MQLDRISHILTYVNGKTGDKSDDIIPEFELYGYLCRIIDRLVEDELPPEADSVHDLISEVLAGYEERAAGAAKRLERACAIIVMTYYAALVRKKANILYEQTIGHI